MQLSMTVLRCPDQVAPEARSVSGGEFHVGRGPDVDWVLPDPDRLLSKRHFAVAFRGGAWQVADTSTNGTFLNTDADAIGRGAARSLQDGDRLRLGAYEIEIRLIEDAGLGAGGSGGYSAAGGSRSSQSPFGDSFGGDAFGEDPMAAAPAARRPFNEQAYPDLGLAPTSAQLPHDFDPLAPDRDEHAFGGGFRGPVQSDHSSSMDDAMIAPQVSGYSAPHTGGIIPGDDQLPDDWDKDLLEGIGAPQPAQNVPPPMSRPAPASFEPLAPAPRAPGPLADFDPDAFADLAPPAQPVPYQEPPRQDQEPPRQEPVSAPPILAPVSPPAPAAPAPAAFAPPSPAPIQAAPGIASLDNVDFLDELGPLAPAESAPPPPIPATPPAFAPAPMTAPVVRQRAPRPAAVLQALPEADPFNEEPPAAPAILSPQPATAVSPPQPTAAAALAQADVSPFDEPADAVKPSPVVAAKPVDPPKMAVAAPLDTASALAAFFKGAELSGANPDDPNAMMTGLGKAFRAMVSGLRAVLIARATIKNEFRIEQTMIRARGNNPLKFSANDDDALTALLGVGRRTDMAPAAAIEDSLRDLRLHEVATMAAMQVAVRAMLDELSPDKIRAGAETGGMAVLPGQRKARAWDAFEARHSTVVRALVDDFDSIFGKSFARAYERALDEISTRERQ
jgi:type VI secretion system FHA domain protein